MKLAKMNRFIGVVLAMVFVAGLISVPNESNDIVASAREYNEPIVRVGMCVDAPTLDNRVYSSNVECGSGLEIGSSSSESFSSILKLSETKIVVLAQVNTTYNSKKVGAYSALISSHSNYSDALSAANAFDGFVAIVNGGFEARAFSANSADEVSSLCGGRTVKAPVSGGLLVLNRDGKILLSFEDTSRTFALRGVGGSAVSINTTHRTGAVNNYSYNGFMEYSVSGGKLWVVNCIGLEDYTKCVMANEIGTNVSKETRKAFSVLARTVPLNSKHKNQGFDVCCNSACCQVYYGLHRMSAENNAIVDSTRGLFCAYKGAPIAVLYHNSNGGASCSSVAAWGGDAVPYLTTVFMEEEGDTDIWTREYTKDEFYKYLSSRRTFSSLKDKDISMKIIETDPFGSDYITVLSVTDGCGNTITVENSEDIRSACGFSSANFDIEYLAQTEITDENGEKKKVNIKGVVTSDGIKEFEGFDESYNVVGVGTIEPQKVVINGEGAGHGVGFSAIGSEKLAADGYSYEYILGFFFTGTTLEYAK